jgi:hypothetical protein
MIIINDNYRIESDEYCYSLRERSILKSGKNIGGEVWRTLSYHRTVQAALYSYRNRRIKTLSGDDTDVKIEKWISSVGEQDEAFKTFLETLNIKNE